MTPAPRRMPRHLRDRLAAQGVLIDGLTVHPKQTRCRKCGAAIDVALDPSTIGPIRIINDKPLTALGEALALIAGLDTYTVTETGIEWRDKWRIDNCPTEKDDVRADHKCGMQYQTRPGNHGPAVIEDQNKPAPY